MEGGSIRDLRRRSWQRGKVASAGKLADHHRLEELDCSVFAEQTCDEWRSRPEKQLLRAADLRDMAASITTSFFRQARCAETVD